MVDMKIEGNRRIVFLTGRIDSSNAVEAEAQIRSALQGSPDLPWLLDAGALDYISSAGLRMLLKLNRGAPTRLTIRNVSPLVYDTLSMTGFTEILDVKKRLRSISVEGCPVIGRGAIGTVYRLDEDTIVKVYQIPDCEAMIENEQKLAKQAFVRGIPTAISYDVVRVGERYGSVFEMLHAENCNDLIAQAPERADEILRQYVALMKTVHGVEMLPGELPDARDVYTGYLSAIGARLPRGMAERIRKLLADMPADLHAVHGDLQMKNVMLSDGGPLLIDMETLCTGDPVFDFAGLYVAYCAFNDDEPGNCLDFLGIDLELCTRIYRTILAQYLGAADEAALRRVEDRIETLGYVRFLYLIAALNLGKPELKEIRIRHTLERLEALLARVDRLCLAPRAR